MINLGAEHENLDQKAYSILKNLIIERKLLPGEKIPQEKLARDLGISRTPLISALKFLEHEKLVESVPRRGFFVRLFICYSYPKLEHHGRSQMYLLRLSPVP